MVLIPPVRRQPALLAGPTRTAGLARRHARIAAGALILLLLLGTMVVLRVGMAPIDSSLSDGIVDGVRHGARFYEVAADAGDQAGTPLSALGVPLPSLALVTGAMPLAGAIALFWVLGVVTVLAWWERLPAMVRGRGARSAGGALVALGVAGNAWPTLVAVPEAWAGLFVALSLGRWRPHAPVEAAAFGLAAAVIAPSAYIYLGVMIVGAATARRWREATAWGVAGAIGLAVLAAHAHALAALAESVDAIVRAPGSDTGHLFAPAIVSEALPFALTATLAVPALAGWMAWRDPVAARVLAVTVTAAVTASMSDGTTVGLIAAPLLPLGLLALPDLIGDLAASALDRRRITVTRPGR